MLKEIQRWARVGSYQDPNEFTTVSQVLTGLTVAIRCLQVLN